MDLNFVWEKLLELVKLAEASMPGSTGAEKKAWCIDEALSLVNTAESFIPFLSAWANLPFVDGAERYLIGLGIERAWVVLQLSN